MYLLISAPVLQFLVILGFYVQMVLCDCPRLCDCKWKSGKESVICLNANLSVIPLQLERGTQIIDLSGNTIASVKQDEFSQAGLLNLQKIYLSKCHLKGLDRYAFRNLNNLVELDLSLNELSMVPSHSLNSIPELRELRLNGNPIQSVTNGAFSKVPQLVRLELSDCKIVSISNNAFSGLESSLEWLKLENNKLTVVNSASFTVLQCLHGLELSGNPWDCSCRLRPLRVWMVEKNVPFGVPPVCSSPKRLSRKSWDKLELDEFACVPRILASDNKAHGVEGKNVTMSCRIAGIPEPNVHWLLKNKVIANLSDAPYSNGKKLYVVRLQNNASDLTILTADVQDAGVYVCSAENKAGRAEASVTLAMSRKPAEQNLNSKVLFASLIAGTIFVLALSLTVLCVYTARKNQVRWRRNDCNREDNYEKIEMNRKHNVNGNPRGDISVVGSIRNGEYRVVPGAETDQDADDDEECNYESSIAAARQSQGVGNVHYSDSCTYKTWNFSDQQDLHIPRRAVKETRGDFMENSNLTSGTFNTNYPSQFSEVYSTREIPGERKSEFSSTISSLTESVFDKKYPDLLEDSSRGLGSDRAAKASSEGGSVRDITDLFCTLPRKRELVRNCKWRSCDSQSPLLQESSCGSSGGDSNSGSYSSSLTPLASQHKYSKANTKNTNSNLNYIGASDINSVTTQNPNSVPLLDINSLENRIHFKPEIVNSAVTSSINNANPYDYHAAQLEHFLEEYRILQKELSKMKQTCDNMRQDQTYVDNLMKKHNLTGNPLVEEGNTVSLIETTNETSTLDNSVVGFLKYDSELTKYFLSKDAPSPKTFNSDILNN